MLLHEQCACVVVLSSVQCASQHGPPQGLALASFFVFFMVTNVYQCLLRRYVTFDGIALACAEAMGISNPELVHYNPKDFDFGKKKAFPMRDQHFFASVDKVRVLWTVSCTVSSARSTW